MSDKTPLWCWEENKQPRRYRGLLDHARHRKIEQWHIWAGGFPGNGRFVDHQIERLRDKTIGRCIVAVEVNATIKGWRRNDPATWHNAPWSTSWR